MEAKLIKTFYGYELLTQGFVKGSTNHELIDSLNIEEGTIRYKLSLKNCQAIELGYDLDELAEEWVDVNSHKWSNNNNEVGDNYGSFKSGFQKALELNSTKLFTLEDMMNCWNKVLTFQNHKETLGEHLATLQQTEWDVIIKMRPASLVYISNLVIEELDADGCLILKRK
jgi:hypothetical protein